MHKLGAFFTAGLVALALSGCARLIELDDQPLSLSPMRFDELPAWWPEGMYDPTRMAQAEHVGLRSTVSGGDVTTVWQALSRSCDRILNNAPDKQFGPDPRWGFYADWQAPCRAMVAYAQANGGDPTENPVAFKRLLGEWYVPYQASANGFFSEGLFTGYFEASLDGAQAPNARYRYPLYKRPAELLDVNLGAFREEWAGERLAGHVKGNRFVPYLTREEIMQGALEGRGLELVWVDDPVDAFFLHIQGSGQVRLPNGNIMRVGYAGQNGHPYYAIGRELVARGYLDKDAVTMQSIREWLQQYPQQAQEIKALNPSYIFFRQLDTAAPIGAEGLPLTPQHSLAIDDRHVPYGVPVWLEVGHPIYRDRTFHKLMVTQDTGGAIRGPVRGDFFWGAGPEAEALAGPMKSPGEYWFLIPKSLAGRVY